MRRRVVSQRFEPRAFEALPDPAPLISVIVLSYNSEATLPRCLDAIFAQDYPSFEVLVIDNASADGSRTLLEQRSMVEPRLRPLFLDNNAGVAGGRNAALEHCSGALLAFIDSDGYPDPGWLSAAARALHADQTLGAIASLVFFAAKETVLNGAGGSRTPRGFAGDYAFNEPLEYAELPSEVLYPMGCGMVLTRRAADEVFPLDDALPKWFDDTELGERLWRRGYRVEVCREAQVLHGFHGSEASVPVGGFKTALLFERARLRHVIKYAPPKMLGRWVRGEWMDILKAVPVEPKRALTSLFAWIQTLAQVRSALSLRRRYLDGAARALSRYVREGRSFPSRAPRSDLLRTDLSQIERSVDLSAPGAEAMLHYGWYPPAVHAGRTCRKISSVASAFFAPGSSDRLVLELSAAKRCRVALVLRRGGFLEPVFTASLELEPGGWSIRTIQIPRLPEGIFELLLQSEGVSAGSSEDDAVCAASISFEAL